MMMRHGYPRTRDRRAKIGIGAFVAVAARAARNSCFELAFLTLFALPVLVSGCVFGRSAAVPWYMARRDPTGLAPDPATTPDGVIQVYAARAVSWRGVFSVHTWIIVKPAGAARYSRYEVLGFGVANGAPSVRVDRTGPDNYWFGARPVGNTRPPRAGSRPGHRRNSPGRGQLATPTRMNTAPGPAPIATLSPPLWPVGCQS